MSARLRALADLAVRQGPTACVALTEPAARELLAVLDHAERAEARAERLAALVRACQRDLAACLPPDAGITDREVISALLGRLDGPEARDALGGEETEETPLSVLAARNQMWADKVVRLRADLAALRARAERAEAALRTIGRMRLFPDDRINRTTLAAALTVARDALPLPGEDATAVERAGRAGGSDA